MSKRERAIQVGECPCPVAGCEKSLAVYRYGERPSKRPSMFKGKFHARCADHGQVINAFLPASQEHFLNKGKVWGPNDPPAAPATQLAPEPVTEPAPEPVREPPKSLSVVPQEPDPPRAGWLRGWNLWDWLKIGTS